MKKLNALQTAFDSLAFDPAMQKLLDVNAANQSYRERFQAEINRLQLGIDNLQQLLSDYQETAKWKVNLLKKSTSTGNYIVTEFYYKDPAGHKTFSDAYDAMQYAHVYSAEHPLHWATVEEISSGKQHHIFEVTGDTELADLDLMATHAAYHFETYGEVKQ